MSDEAESVLLAPPSLGSCRPFFVSPRSPFPHVTIPIDGVLSCSPFPPMGVPLHRRPTYIDRDKRVSPMSLAGQVRI